MRAFTSVAVVLLMTLAGCMQATDRDDAGRADVTPLADWAEGVLTWPSGHDHADPAHHGNLSTPNFELVGYDPLISSYYGTTAGAYFCGDAQETIDGRRLAVVESRTDVAFAIADVTDAASPRWLGELVLKGTYVYDLAIVPDGKHVVLTTADVRPQGLLEPPAASPETGRNAAVLHAEGPAKAQMFWKRPCDANDDPGRLVHEWVAEDPVTYPASLLLVDITDPTQPQVIDQRPNGGLGHSIFATMTADGPLILNSVYSVLEETSTFQFYTIAAGPIANQLEFLSAYTVAMRTDDPTNYGKGTGHNDGWIASHPITGATLAYLAQWDEGVHIVNVDDPRQPTLVGTWQDYITPHGAYAGNAHSVYPLGTAWDGAHYTLVGPEWEAAPPERPTGTVWVLDTTDPTAPYEVAAWTLPIIPEWSGRLMFSNHYLSAVNQTAFVSMYHAGVWALDLSNVSRGTFTLLPSIGVYMPLQLPPTPAAEPMRWAPTVEEALAFEDGTLVTFDANSGLYTLTFDPDLPIVAPEPFPLEAITWAP